MRPGMRAMLLSAVAHALILGGGVAASKYMHSASPAIPIDMTQFSDGGGGGGEGSDSAPSGEESMPVVPPSVTPTPTATADAAPLPDMPSVLSNSAEAAPIAAPAAVTPGPQAVPGSAPTGKGGGSGHGGGVGNGRGTGTGSGVGSGQGGGTGNGRGDGMDVLRAIYLREHFAYIRDRIARHLIYPPVAIRAGLSGKVLVSFVILEDGRINELRVARSSGISLLDRDAQETVTRSVPFPRPPVSARIVIPVEYLLQ